MAVFECLLIKEVTIYSKVTDQLSVPSRFALIVSLNIRNLCNENVCGYTVQDTLKICDLVIMTNHQLLQNCSAKMPCVKRNIISCYIKANI